MQKHAFSKRILPVLLGLLTAAGLAGCAGQPVFNPSSEEESSLPMTPASSQVSAVDQELKTVRIGAVDDNGVLSDTARIAQVKGFFEEELRKAGYRPEYISFGWGGQPLNEALTAGEIDVAMSDQMSQLILKSSGIDISLIATVNARIQNGVAVQADSGITSFRDLEGKKVIVPTGSTQDLYFHQLVKAYGMDESKIERINTVSDIVSVFAAKEADAVLYGLYTAYYMEGYGMGTTIETTFEHPEWTSQSFVAGRKSYWQENSEAAKAIIRALTRAQQYAEETGKDNPDEVYKMLSKDEFSESVNKRMYGYDTSFSYFKPEITDESMQKLEVTASYLLEQGMITQPLELSDLVDTSFCEAVQNQV